jgi:hypothetical protein
MTDKKWMLIRIVYAAEQHFDYVRRSLASETGRYTVDEHDQLWRDICHMWDFIPRMEDNE